MSLDVGNLQSSLLNYLREHQNKWYTVRELMEEIETDHSTESSKRTAFSRSLRKLNNKSLVDREKGKNNAYKYRHAEIQRFHALSNNTPLRKQGLGVGTAVGGTSETQETSGLKQTSISDGELVATDSKKEQRELNRYEKEAIRFFTNFFDPMEELKAHKITFVADWKWLQDTKKPMFLFDWNAGITKRRVKMNFADGDEDTVLLTIRCSDFPMRMFELWKFIEFLLYLQQFRVFEYKTRVKGIIDNVGIASIELNQDFDIGIHDFEYVSLTVLKDKLRTVELSAYQKPVEDVKGIVESVARREMKVHAPKKARMELDEMVSMMVKFGGNLYDRYEMRQRDQELLDNVEKQTQYVTQLVSQVEQYVGYNFEKEEKDEATRKLLAGSIKQIANSLDILTDEADDTKEMVQQILKDKTVVTSQLEDLSQEERKIFKMFEEPATIREVAEILDHKYKFVWDRVDSMRDMGLISVYKRDRPMSLVQSRKLEEYT